MPFARSAFLALCVCFAAVLGCSSGTELTAPPDSSQLEIELWSTLDDFMGNNSGGVSVVVTREGETVALIAGQADAAATLDSNDRFRVGSISKPLVATMVLQLVDEGALSLDDTVGTHVDTPLGSENTIRELLGHRSGLPNYTAQPRFFTDAFAQRDRRLDADDIFEYVIDTPAEPAGIYSYSNTNYILLGLLVEAVDGRDLNASLAARITGPLNMTDTFFATLDQTQDQAIAGWAPGFLEGEANAEYTSLASGAWAAGSLLSTADDLAVFLRALSAGELMTEASFAEMTEFGEVGYGLGMGSVFLGVGNRGIGHNGAIPGFSSSMAIVPGNGDLVVALTNNERLQAERLTDKIVEDWN